MKVRWTREAADEMKQILVHLREVNPLAARKIRNMVLGFVDMISSMPYIAPAYQENRRYRVWAGVYPYRFFYHIDEQEDCIFIDAVIHGRQQEPYLQ